MKFQKTFLNFSEIRQKSENLHPCVSRQNCHEIIYKSIRFVYLLDLIYVLHMSIYITGTCNRLYVYGLHQYCLLLFLNFYF